MKLTLNQKFKSLEPFSIELPDFVVLTGINGAGKTQILLAISQKALNVMDKDRGLNRCKYVASQALSPNNEVVVNRQQQDQITRSLWQKFNQYSKNPQRMPNFRLETLWGENSRETKLVKKYQIMLKKV